MRIVFDHILRVSTAVRAQVRAHIRDFDHSAARFSVPPSARNVVRLRTAGSAILTAFILVACGQRGPLYLPTIPPLPPSPTAHSAASAPGTAANEAAPASDAAESSTRGDATGQLASPDTATSDTAEGRGASGSSKNISNSGNTASGSK